MYFQPSIISNHESNKLIGPDKLKRHIRNQQKILFLQKKIILKYALYKKKYLLYKY